MTIKLFTDFVRQKDQNTDKHLHVSSPDKVEILFEIDYKADDYWDSRKSIKWLKNLNLEPKNYTMSHFIGKFRKTLLKHSLGIGIKEGKDTHVHKWKTMSGCLVFEVDKNLGHYWRMNVSHRDEWANYSLKE